MHKVLLKYHKVMVVSKLSKNKIKKNVLIYSLDYRLYTIGHKTSAVKANYRDPS